METAVKITFKALSNVSLHPCASAACRRALVILHIEHDRTT